MKLLLIGLDGVRLDVALPAAMHTHPGFAAPDHPGDPKLAAEPRPDDAPEMPATSADAGSAAGTDAHAAPLARTLARLLDGGTILPMWMTPPTDSGPGWASLLTGTTHERNNVWWNEFVGHRLATCPDILSQVFFADPRARTYAASTWDALTGQQSPGPVIHRRIDQQTSGQHRMLWVDDTTHGYARADVEVRTHACSILNHEGPDAAFVYFEEVDAAGHAHGAASQEYRDAIAAVDEHVRYLIKAVAERYEQLGEEWLIAVTTDHGHKPEGGHGEDEVDVRRSFLLLHRIGPDGVGDRLRADVAERVEADRCLHSEDVTPLLLDLIGVRDGRWDADHPVGELRDIPSVGPTRDLRYEW